MAVEALEQIQEPGLGAVVRERVSAIGRTLRTNPNLLVGSTILVIMSVIAIIAPLIDRIDPQELDPPSRIQRPSAAHWFGTDHLGRDVYSRTIHGTIISLRVAASVTVIVVLIGVSIGVVVGYNRVTDNIVMRIMDGMMAFPTLILALALVATLGSSLNNVILVIVVVDMPGMVRIVRGVVLSLRERAYVEAAQAIGTPLPRVLFQHIAPNTLAPVFIQASVIFAYAILTEAALSFLGVGVPPYIPSWGNIVGQGREYIQVGFWIAFFPGVFLALTVLATNLVGDGLRDVIDPRLRGAR